jgi:hypothetical protein
VSAYVYIDCLLHLSHMTVLYSDKLMLMKSLSSAVRAVSGNR